MNPPIKSKPKLDFTRIIGRCIHVTVEAVYEISDIASMEEILDQLRQYGSAEVVKKDLIAEDFTEACQILSRRALK